MCEVFDGGLPGSRFGKHVPPYGRLQDNDSNNGGIKSLDRMIVELV